MTSVEEPLAAEPLPSTSKCLDLPIDDDIHSQSSEPETKNNRTLNMSQGAVKLRQWLNKTLRVEMSDGRILIGAFLCTDKDANIILTMCYEYLPEECDEANDGEIFPATNNTAEEPRMLGLVMVPGRHIVSIHIDQNSQLTVPLTEDIADFGAIE